MQKLNRLAKLLFVLQATALFGTLGHAYIPPSAFIVKTWVGKHAHHKKLKLKTLVTTGDKRQGATVQFKELFVLTEAGVARSWAMNDSDQVLYYQERGLKQLSLPSQLLFNSDSSDLMRHLIEKGIPILTDPQPEKVEQEYLKRMNDSVSWVISQKPLQKDGPQVWFEKDTFFPLRLVFSTSESTRTYDLNYENFRRDYLIPRFLTLRGSSGEVVLTGQVQDFGIQSDIPKPLRSSAPGWTPLGESASANLKTLIQTYYQSLR